jgi:hypothetical protein
MIMKRLALASVLFGVGVFSACASEDPVAPPVGTGGTATGGTSPTGGTDTGGTATGGTATGGTATGGTATGGTATGGTATGGTATGGTSTGGTAPTGGTAGDMGMGGMGMGGLLMGGAGGSTTGGMGGMLMGGSGGKSMGGAGGTSAGSGGTTSGDPTIDQLVGKLDGHLITTPCGDTPNTDDCAGGGWRSNAVDNGANHPCSGARLEALITFPIGGTPGTQYDVTAHFYGVMEPRQYSSVMREATGATNRTGGTPTGWAEATGTASVYTMGDNNYNTYEIHVYDNANPKVRVRQYFLNSDSGTGHYTMLTNYEKTITVVGGGEVRLRVFDANCRMIKNCGQNGGAPCTGKARTVDTAAAMPQPAAPLTLQQPALGASSPDHSGQWWLFDVTRVARKP